MARTYREIAIEEMLGTVEKAMCQVIDWWGDLPPPMKEATEQFRTRLGAAIDSVEFVKRARSAGCCAVMSGGNVSDVPSDASAAVGEHAGFQRQRLVVGFERRHVD
jgi:hypothetical protein